MPHVIRLLIMNLQNPTQRDEPLSDTLGAQMDITLHGYSESQLEGVDFKAIAKAYAQDATKSPMPVSSTDGMKTPNGIQDNIPTPRVIPPKLDPGGRFSEELGQASARANGHEDLSHLTTIANSPCLASGDGVMPIAIVGMSCRFPGGASDIEKFCELVSEGRSAWSKVPENRFNVDAFYHPDADRTDTVSSRTKSDLAS